MDASRNGGIRVRGWDRTDIRLTAEITVYAETDARARALAGAVRIETGGPHPRRGAGNGLERILERQLRD